jgi:hypothetical protein
MAQHDYIISNQTFPNTRADLNNVLQAIATCNKGSSAPTTQYAGQMWIDDSAGTTWTLYLYDGSDNIQVATIDTTANTINFIDSVVSGFDIVTDTTPQLGGNLDLNSNDITGTGNINITGTVTSDGLTVDGNASLTTSGANGLVINQRTDNAGNSANIFLSDSSGTVGIQSSSGAFRFNTGATVGSASGTERMRIDSSGNVLVGTTDENPADSSVNDGIRLGTNGGTQIGTNGLTVLALNRNTNDGIHIDIRRQGSRIGYIGTNTSNLGLGTGDVGLLFDDDLDTIFPANPDASLGTRNNAMDLGSASATFRRIYLGSAAVIQEQTLTDGATISWDVSTKSVAKVTLGGNRTLSAPSNALGAGQFISLLVIQDGTGSRTLTWNAVYEFASDTAPTLTTTGGKGDLFVFRYNGTKWLEVGRNLNLSLS